jgi:serine/threonine-protein kinase
MFYVDAQVILPVQRMSNKKACLLCSQEFAPDQSVCPVDGTLLTPVAQDRYLGTKLLGRLEILEILGCGGMGTVYKAYDLMMNRIVAIKMLHQHLTNNPEAVKRFHLEAQAASRLSLPNILTVHDFGVSDEGQPYMVMDYLEGVSLSDVLEKEKRLTVERSLSIFIQGCAGLAHAHQKGVLHRDLKPSNIMLVNYSDDQEDFVKIVDFGIAKILNRAGDAGSVNLTRTGEVYGSPLYMSPEQCRGMELDARSDLYSFGCVMYKTLTGLPVFTGSELIELLFKQVSEMPAKFAKICPEANIPPALEEIVFKSLAKHPDDRYSSMTALKDVLEAYKRKLTGEETGAMTPKAVADVGALQELIQKSSSRKAPHLSNFTSRSTAESHTEAPPPESEPKPAAAETVEPGDHTIKTGAQPDLSAPKPVALVLGDPDPTSALPVETAKAVKKAADELMQSAKPPAQENAAAPVAAQAPAPVSPPSRPAAKAGTDWSLLMQGLLANKLVVASIGGLILVSAAVTIVALSSGNKEPGKTATSAPAQMQKPADKTAVQQPAKPAQPSTTKPTEPPPVTASAPSDGEENDTESKQKSSSHHAHRSHPHRPHRHAYSSYGL